MGPQNLKQLKQALRRQLMARRAAAFALQPRAHLALHDHFFAHFSRLTGVIASYMALQNELSTLPITDSLAASGHLLALPVIIGKGQPLEFRLYHPGDVLIESDKGILEPGPAAPRANPATLLVPLLGFDRFGHRLGYGGGYYDRTLHLLRSQGPVLTIGIGFACQEVEQVPAGSNDQKLDHILTEEGPVVLMADANLV